MDGFSLILHAPQIRAWPDFERFEAELAVEVSAAGDENPRTGVGTQTSRYYDEDKNRSEMERTTYRGDEYVKTERHTDFDNGTSEVQRKTSQGGGVTTTRELSNGTLTSTGTGTTADGRDLSVSSEATRSGGSSTITGEQRSADITTKRGNDSSVSQIEGSQGGKATSVSGQGPGRTTVGQSGSGDLYAGHNGNVYKKTDDGWQQRQSGGWQPVDTPERTQAWRDTGSAGANTANRTSGTANRTSAQPRQSSTYGGQRSTNQDFSRLNRDYGARQQGNRQFQQRSRGSFGGSGMGGVRGGGRRR